MNNLCGFFVIQKRVFLPQPVARSLAGSLNQRVPADGQVVEQLKQTPSHQGRIIVTPDQLA
ncbi:hypothetical protein DBQ69_11845 [Lactobacillus sp. DS1_6]|nr:hypothetical protein LCALPC37_1680 [Lacticaseibacillus paracasei]EPC41982.1 hypothetical protein Lpp74_08805 [Lacticaseibacillus paracasei subsp. paracasei Lpp74]PTS44382.1 hypothetical protein DBQ69_11845 [Lactobacillus sp. DS1_6]PTS48836.1 hypothetical protein DBQ60_11925 [Lactobacillus sp. DS2_6]PTV38113.1 hypothetical protein DB344_11940 [Lactobacillus sp. DS13_6]